MRQKSHAILPYERAMVSFAIERGYEDSRYRLFLFWSGVQLIDAHQVAQADVDVRRSANRWLQLGAYSVALLRWNLCSFISLDQTAAQ